MLDFVRMCQDRHIPYLTGGHHHCKQGWVQTHCPFCAGGRGGWHLGYSHASGAFNCWRCGKLAFRQVLEALIPGIPLGDLLRAYGGATAGPQTPVQRPRPAREAKAPPGAGPLLGAHRAYLAGRGFDPDELAAEWGVMGTGAYSGPWAWRVVYPICTAAGLAAAYQGRAIGPALPKYKLTDTADCTEDPKGLLYGLDKALGDAVLVVEGSTGAWRLGPGAVATLGIDWKERQAAQLRGFGRRYIIFDPEPKAQERAWELANYLALFPGKTEVLDGFTTDPGEFPPRLVKKLRRLLLMPRLV